MDTKKVKVRLKDIKKGLVIYVASPYYGIERLEVVSSPYLCFLSDGSLLGYKFDIKHPYLVGRIDNRFIDDMGITCTRKGNSRRAFFCYRHADNWDGAFRNINTIILVRKVGSVFYGINELSSRRYIINNLSWEVVCSESEFKAVAENAKLNILDTITVGDTYEVFIHSNGKAKWVRTTVFAIELDTVFVKNDSEWTCIKFELVNKRFRVPMTERQRKDKLSLIQDTLTSLYGGTTLSVQANEFVKEVFDSHEQ